MIKSRFAFHVHHDSLVEWCYDYAKRIAFIEANKPAKEQELRLKLFRMIPTDRLPPKLISAREDCDKALEALDKAWEALDKAGEARDKAREDYDKARKALNKAWEALDKARGAYYKILTACMPELIKLHEELCPDCPWDGETIFSEKK